MRCRCSARFHAGIAWVAADPPKAALGGRELLRRRRLLSGLRACTEATFTAGESVPRSARSTACAGWRSRTCVGRANLALTPIGTHGTPRRNPTARLSFGAAARAARARAYHRTRPDSMGNEVSSRDPGDAPSYATSVQKSSSERVFRGVLDRSYARPRNLVIFFYKSKSDVDGSAACAAAIFLVRSSSSSRSAAFSSA